MKALTRPTKEVNDEMYVRVFCHEDTCPYGKKCDQCCVAEVDPDKTGNSATLRLRCPMKESRKIKAVYVRPTPDETI